MSRSPWRPQRTSVGARRHDDVWSAQRVTANAAGRWAHRRHPSRRWRGSWLRGVETPNRSRSVTASRCASHGPSRIGHALRPGRRARPWRLRERPAPDDRDADRRADLADPRWRAGALDVGCGSGVLGLSRSARRRGSSWRWTCRPPRSRRAARNAALNGMDSTGAGRCSAARRHRRHVRGHRGQLVGRSAMVELATRLVHRLPRPVGSPSPVFSGQCDLVGGSSPRSSRSIDGRRGSGQRWCSAEPRPRPGVMSAESVRDDVRT